MRSVLVPPVLEDVTQEAGSQVVWRTTKSRSAFSSERLTESDVVAEAMY